MRMGLAAAAVAVLVAGYIWLQTDPAPARTGPTLQLSSPAAEPKFSRAYGPRGFQFPQDHGPHFDYETEWWYYTGNLDTETGRHFAYQLTFFRRGLSPGQVMRESTLATNQLYFAHLALTDVSTGEHPFYERFSRGAAGLAGAEGDPYRVWLEDWSVTSLNADATVLEVRASESDIGIELLLEAKKPIVAHGEDGWSPKSDEAGNASYYLSFTRMRTSGSIALGGERFEVAGESWFDHEWSTSALGPDAVGWDWFSLQLSDGRELMYFQIRRSDGGIEMVSSGTLIEPDGSTRTLGASQVEIDVLSSWRSSRTGTEYPSGWRLTVPSAGIVLELQPWIEDQEMPLLFPYWEGAVKISGFSDGIPITGNGFVELTGYEETMQGVF